MKFLKALDRVAGFVQAATCIPTIIVGVTTEGLLHGKKGKLVEQASNVLNAWNELVVHGVRSQLRYGLVGSLTYEGVEKDMLKHSLRWAGVCADIASGTGYAAVGEALKRGMESTQEDPGFFMDVQKIQTEKLKRIFS